MFLSWSKTEGYEVSSIGDRRFSALYARMPDGRTIEEHYQCDIKGYDPGGTNWRKGKGRKGLNPLKNLFLEYLDIWKQWSDLNPDLMEELRIHAERSGGLLRDSFATGEVNQANALAIILNRKVLGLSS